MAGQEVDRSKNDFSKGPVWKCIVMQAVPLTIAQLVQLLYNVIDRIYIGHMGDGSSIALTGVGLTFPIVTLIMAFTALFGIGGVPLFSMARGAGKKEQAEKILGNSFGLLTISAVILTVVSYLFCRPILFLFGASEASYGYAQSYLKIYLIGTPFVMISLGMNPFINAQGYSTIGMLSVTIGAVTNLLLDPLFIFVFGLGVRGAAIATVISQTLSAAFVFFFLTKKAELKVRLLKKEELASCTAYAKNIVSLGTAGFIMQLTNSLVTIVCNNVLSVTGGDIYISVMTIVSSVRQLVETPIYAINEGTSPILSYNYGARRPCRVRKAGAMMALMILGYTAVMWSIIIIAPKTLIGIFSSDTTLMKDAVPALKQYFAAFICMDMQYIGQTVFKSLNKKKQAIFFSLLRKVFIVVPLTYLMPYALHMGTDGVFLAEPVSNVIGGGLCFITMLLTVLPELKRMERKNALYETGTIL